MINIKSLNWPTRCEKNQSWRSFASEMRHTHTHWRDCLIFSNRFQHLNSVLSSFNANQLECNFIRQRSCVSVSVCEWVDGKIIRLFMFRSLHNFRSVQIQCICKQTKPEIVYTQIVPFIAQRRQTSLHFNYMHFKFFVHLITMKTVCCFASKTVFSSFVFFV